MKNLRPALIVVDGSAVMALELTDMGGILAVPTDQPHKQIGSVIEEPVLTAGLSGMRWFAHTSIGARLGPFTARPLAVLALIEWANYRAADVSETSAPLF